MDKDAVLKTLNASWSWNWQGDHPSLGIGPFLEYHGIQGSGLYLIPSHEFSK